MNAANADVIVIGAGIVGAACVYALAREKLRVTVVEAGLIGGGATAAGMGHVVVMDDSPAQFALTHYSQQCWREIIEDLTKDCEYEACGTLWVAADDEEMEAVRHKQDGYQRHGVAAERLDPAALAGAEPHLRPGLAGGLRVPGDFVIYPPCVARWLIERARDHGAEVRLGVSVREITGDGCRLSDGTLLSVPTVVIATGARAPELTPGLPLRPRKGHLIITDRYPDFIHHQLIELGYLKSAAAVAGDSVAFNVQPRITGQLLLGSSRQYDDATCEVDMVLLRKMIARAQEYMPALASLSAIRIWTGFRDATPDKLPMIGPWPGQDHLYLATGHEGLGITMCLGTAQLLTDHILGRDSAIPREPYLPSRLVSGGKP